MNSAFSFFKKCQIGSDSIRKTSTINLTSKVDTVPYFQTMINYLNSCYQDEKEKKRLEALERKQATKELLEKEEKETKGKTRAGPSKVTRAEIAASQEQQSKPVKTRKSDESEIEENPNIKMAELLAAEGAVEARSVEDAISVLSVKDNVEKHPEKRMKAAYLAFEEANLPRLKQENPNMRLSQLKQLLKKEWMKSPENPMNQACRVYNSKT